MEHSTTNKTWELNLYELHRTPHEPITDNTEIAVSPRSLRSELMCPICLDILKNTMTTKECLHRFCYECIITALRSGNKECPTCRKKLISKRSLRPDPNFDALIAKIYPNRDEYEAHQERLLAKIKQQHNSATVTDTTQDSTKQQHAGKAPKIRKLSSTGTVSGNAADTTDDSSRGQNENTTNRDKPNPDNIPSEVEVILKPHPEDRGLDSNTRYIRTTSNATVQHLAKYIAIRMVLEKQNTAAESVASAQVDETKYSMFLMSSSGQFVPVARTMTLKNICETYERINSPLDIYYLEDNAALEHQK